MNDNEAIAIAKTYVSEIYADEQVTNIGLEEIEVGLKSEDAVALSACCLDDEV